MEQTDDPLNKAAIPEISLRPEAPGDEALLFEVYAGTREAELNLTSWDAVTRRAFLDMQFKAMRQGYRGMYPGAQFAVIVAGEQPVGRLVVNRQDNSVHVVDIALLPAFCGRGIGTAVMRKLQGEAGEAGKKVRLRARRDPRTLRFYQRLGFAIVAEAGLDFELEWPPLTQP
jgi:ribosomal protein S18 acetylase RimI-like enzyme